MTSKLDITKQVAASAARFVAMIPSHRLRLRRDRLGEPYVIDQRGTYEIFRETVSKGDDSDQAVVLVVGFRLRALHSNSALHWLFQRGCILTTPFWSGFRGFRVKLWMVDPVSKNYLGIYDWAGIENAQTYVDMLMRVLRPLSTPESVWRELYPNQDFERFLSEHRPPGR